MSADNVLGWEIVLKISHLPSKLHFSAKCSFFGQSLSRGHYQPTYQPPEGVYLLNSARVLSFAVSSLICCRLIDDGGSVLVMWWTLIWFGWLAFMQGCGVTLDRASAMGTSDPLTYFTVIVGHRTMSGQDDYLSEKNWVWRSFWPVTLFPLFLENILNS